MTAQPHGLHRVPAPERSPKAIRAALLPEDHSAFDAEYRAVMAKATEDLDLTPITSFLDRWWTIAVLQVRDEYDQVMQAAAELLAKAERGQQLGTIPWDDARDAQLRAMATGE
jgi:hypothetical protein